MRERKNEVLDLAAGLPNCQIPDDEFTVKPRILYLSQHWPAEAGYGPQQRVLHVGRLLKRFGDVAFVNVSAGPPEEENLRRAASEFETCRIMRPVLVDRGNVFDRLRRRVRRELDSRYVGTESWTFRRDDRTALLQMAQQYDVVWVHNLRTANLIQIDRWPHAVLDIDDIPSCYFRSLSQSREALTERLMDLRTSWVWKRREHHLSKRFGVLAVCSEQDRRYLSHSARTHVIPNGFSPPAVRERVRPERPRVGFIGQFGYRPNQEGVTWFVRSVWPLIQRELPPAELRLVGRGSDMFLPEPEPGIAKLGWLDDPAEEIATWSAMIVPIRFGGGTRVKIAEGFARQCPVVSTTIGALGYDVRHGQEILLADTAKDFASACVDLCRDRQLGNAVSQRAYERFLRCWTWDSMEGAVKATLEDCLGRSGVLTGRADRLSPEEAPGPVVSSERAAGELRPR